MAVWAVGSAYENYVGRWSRRVAVEFLRWLGVPGGRRWLDVGCGTGALTSTVLATAAPSEVVGVDPSDGFLATARERAPGAVFSRGDARALPDGPFDVAVSGLALNFVPEPAKAAAEMARVLTPGGLADVDVRAIEIPTVFADFDDFWRPFLGGQGSAPGYAMSLPANRRDALRDLLRERLPAGPIPLTARVWAVRGGARAES